MGLSLILSTRPLGGGSTFPWSCIPRMAEAPGWLYLTMNLKLSWPAHHPNHLTWSSTSIGFQTSPLVGDSQQCPKPEWVSWGWMELGWLKLSHLAALDTGWRTEDHHWPRPVLPLSQSVSSSRPFFSSHSNCVWTSEREEGGPGQPKTSEHGKGWKPLESSLAHISSGREGGAGPDTLPPWEVLESIICPHPAGVGVLPFGERRPDVTCKKKKEIFFLPSNPDITC